MSCCQSVEQREAAARNLEIEKQLEADKKERLKDVSHKLLLLGPSEAGKSTILKQLRIIYAKGLNEEEKNSYKIVVMTNAITSLYSIITRMVDYQLVFADPDVELLAELLKSQKKNALDEYQTTFSISDEYASAMKVVWKDPAIQKSYSHGHEYHLIDSAKHFLDSLPRIFDPGYVPSDQDIIAARVMTTNITETRITVNRIVYRIYDVAGHRSRRHMWPAYFDDVRAIIFIVALNGYDQTLAEDETVNRMQDGLQLFAAICNHPLFTNTSIMLFLNKIDLFKERIRVSAISDFFPDYTGGDDYTQATGYFGRAFVQLNKNPDKQIYTHLTWATDTSQTKVVMAAVTDTVRRLGLRLSGIL